MVGAWLVVSLISRPRLGSSATWATTGAHSSLAHRPDWPDPLAPHRSGPSLEPHQGRFNHGPARCNVARAPVGLSSDRIVLLRAKLLCELAERLQQGEEARATAIALTGQSDVDSLLEREVADAASSRAASAASEVEHTLARLEVGTYGSCEGCGSPIPFERLEVIPTRVAAPDAPPRELGQDAPGPKPDHSR